MFSKFRHHYRVHGWLARWLAGRPSGALIREPGSATDGTALLGGTGSPRAPS